MSSKSLVIVESPAKAKTINKYLGNDYIVTSSVGHIRQLAYPEDKSKDTKKRNPLVKSMGVDPWNEWESWFDIIPGKEKVVKELKYLAKGCKHIYLATDLDREGEAIAWHLKEVLGYPDSMFSRVTFNEITKTAIQKAFEQPTHLNLAMVNAQKTRQYLDKVTGYTVSPVLWKKIARGLSAGRVQSVAVRLVVEREDEIKSFIPDKYWEIKALVSNKTNEDILLSLDKQHGKTVTKEYMQSLVDDTLRNKVLNILENAKYEVKDVVVKPTTSKPSPPFITSTLQQSASSRLGYGVKRTMQLAQKLYELGYITYMRTDSTNVSIDALNSVREYISNEHGKKYLPEKPNFYSSKENAQEAHECIRPSNVLTLPSQLDSKLEQGADKLYELIRNRFIASQMTPAIYDSTTIQVKADEYEFKTKGRVIVFDGYTKVLKASKSEDDQELPKVMVGEVLNLKTLKPELKYTQPPARYNEASLVKELEKRGIGRPSTYATIISTIQDRGYVKIDKKRFYAENMGVIVSDRLMKSFPELMDYNWTASIESDLDKIANNQLDMVSTLNLFWKNLEHRIDTALKPLEEGGMRGKTPIFTPIKCSQCFRQMAVRYNTQSEPFLGCIGYTDKENQCKHIDNLISTFKTPENEDEEVKHLLEGKRCVNCNSLMESYLIDRKRKIHLCTNSGRCEYFEYEEGDFDLPKSDTLSILCDKCGNFMVQKVGKFGKYMGCQSCNNNRRILPDGSIAPPKQPTIDYPEYLCKKKGAHFVLREGKNGLFFAAHNFPKVKEIRTPLVYELTRYPDRLPERLKFILNAPEVDPDGNSAEIKFHESKGWYVRTLDPKTKKTKWSSVYKDNKWV